MNEQIKKLAEQSGVAYWNGKGLRDMGGCQDEMQTFAELIIRDVLATVKRTQITSPDFEWSMLNNYDLELIQK